MTQLKKRRMLLGDRELVYEVEKKKVKNLNLRVRQDGSVYVSIPVHCSFEEADALVREYGDRILELKDRIRKAESQMPELLSYRDGSMVPLLGEKWKLVVRKGKKRSVRIEGTSLILTVKDPEDQKEREKAMREFLDETAMTVFSRILRENYPLVEKLGVPFPVLKTRDMTARWGSCAVSKGFIILNKRLIYAPETAIAYVTIHELCHFLVPDHSERFYSLLGRFVPDYREQKRLLTTLQSLPYPKKN